jgi:hypothetical protein
MAVKLEKVTDETNELTGVMEVGARWTVPADEDDFEILVDCN